MQSDIMAFNAFWIKIFLAWYYIWISFNMIVVNLIRAILFLQKILDLRNVLPGCMVVKVKLNLTLSFKVTHTIYGALGNQDV